MACAKDYMATSSHINTNIFWISDPWEMWGLSTHAQATGRITFFQLSFCFTNIPELYPQTQGEFEALLFKANFISNLHARAV